jgi:hippurate hydrolase
MASEDNFVIRVRGRGCIAGLIWEWIRLIASQIVLALQTVVSRSLDPACQPLFRAPKCTLTALKCGAHNVVIKGDTRSYSPDVQQLLERRMRKSARVLRAHGGQCEVEYTHEFAPTVNSAECVGSGAAATNVVGAGKADGSAKPMMVSEDFERS